MQTLSQKHIDYLGSKQSLISLPGLLAVLVIHGVLFYVLWNQRMMPAPDQFVTLFAEVLSEPAVQPEVQPEPAPAKLQPVQKKPEPKPKVKQLVAKAPEAPKPQPVVQPEPVVDEPIERTMSPEPFAETSAKPQMPAGPVTLTSELSVSCPSLAAPAYPAISRRMGEEGKLVLKVELDETGRIDDARVVDSSGYTRLDNAALEAVRSWRCRPSIRNGQPVRAIALQPFNFVLQGN